MEYVLIVMDIRDMTEAEQLIYLMLLEYARLMESKQEDETITIKDCVEGNEL